MQAGLRLLETDLHAAIALVLGPAGGFRQRLAIACAVVTAGGLMLLTAAIA